MQIQIDYDAYLRSDHWRGMRTAKLFLDGDYDDSGKVMCSSCDGRFGPSGIEIHHNTYERIGCERLSDLVICCGVCHGLVMHERWPTTKEFAACLGAAFQAPYETKVERLRQRYDYLKAEILTKCFADSANSFGVAPRMNVKDVEEILRHYWDIRELLVTAEIRDRIFGGVIQHVYDAFAVPEDKR